MSAAFDRLRGIVARLRAPDGCPWDREQTHASLRPGVLEEAYEVVGAIEAGDTANLREELGDLLLQTVMHAQIASEAGSFDLEQVTNEIADKLVRRHPHVFGESTAADTGAVWQQWEAIKRAEKPAGAEQHYLASVPMALPALMRAQKAQSKAARVGFDWAELRDVIAKVDEELAETKAAIGGGLPNEIEEEIGDLLFAAVNLARKCKLDAEQTLARATRKFIARFNGVEDELRARGRALGESDLAEMDAIWNALKAGPAAG